jgi:hypothetical protein
MNLTVGSAKNHFRTVFFIFFRILPDSQMVWRSNIWYSGSIPFVIILL